MPSHGAGRGGGSVDPAILAAMVERLVAQFQPAQITLFGSQATGRADADSDVDLLIVMPFSGRRLDAAVAIRKTLRGFGVAKDIVLLTPEEFARQRDVPGTVAWPAAREGRVLHAA